MGVWQFRALASQQTRQVQIQVEKSFRRSRMCPGDIHTKTVQHAWLHVLQANVQHETDKPGPPKNAQSITQSVTASSDAGTCSRPWQMRSMQLAVDRKIPCSLT